MRTATPSAVQIAKAIVDEMAERGLLDVMARSIADAMCRRPEMVACEPRLSPKEVAALVPGYSEKKVLRMIHAGKLDATPAPGTGAFKPRFEVPQSEVQRLRDRNPV